MLLKFAFLVLSISTLHREVWARSGGAPSAACNRIFPEGHSGTAQPPSSSPYTLDISAFDGGDYVPGDTYTLVLTGTVDYRGLLVQARTVADDSPVGSFVDSNSLTRLSSCPRSNSAITHNSGVDKNNVSLTFIAPPVGTGPFRFVFAVVRVFVTYYAPLETAILQEETVEPGPIDVYFTGDTPAVIGRDISVQVAVSQPVPLLCQLITPGRPGMPTITAEQNCTDGETTFLNVASGAHRVRIIAGEQDTVIRSRVVVMPNNPNFCSLNAINRGVTKGLNADGSIANYTVEWRPIGINNGFFCFIGNPAVTQRCETPFTFPATAGLRRIKVLPLPSEGRCGGADRRPLVFRLNN